MTVAKGTVPGSHTEHEVVFYGLSTCIWCKRTRQLLESLDIEFDFYYVDLLTGDERKEIMAKVREWNPAVSFPTLVIDNSLSVVGYRAEEIQTALGR